MAEKITHAGIVECVEPGHLAVRIVQASACASCGAKRLCQSAESKEKVVDVYTSDALAYSVGQGVTVIGRASLGMKAVRLAFLYPLVLLMVAFIVCYRMSEGNEALSGLVGLVALVPWYVGLWAFRSRLQTTFTFSVEAGETIAASDPVKPGKPGTAGNPGFSGLSGDSRTTGDSGTTEDSEMSEMTDLPGTSNHNALQTNK